MAQQGEGAGRFRGERRLPIGAEVLERGGVHFRVWAPKRRRVEVILEGQETGSLPLQAEEGGYYSAYLPRGSAGLLYRFKLDDEGHLYPDPASRFQPQGPHGPSQVVDPRSFDWSDSSWGGVRPDGQVLYEMHIGTFTREGTWDAAARELPELKDLGLTCLEVMPVNEFAGRWGWGYDGVDLFAPFHRYGPPEAMRRFINRAHELGLGVILDVVYNHLGPDGNYLGAFSDTYFSNTHRTDWGDALNFDGEGSGAVREFFLSNVRHWIEEYHLDGFRFDATQAIVDASTRHILAEITETARRSGNGRSIYLINENEPQNTRLVRPVDEGGYGMDALWNDDFHHSAVVALSGHAEAYYTDYRGTPQELISAAKWGYLYQGQRYAWQKRRRGTPALDLPPTAFVTFLQNHDQIANSGRGYRLHHISDAATLRALTALMLLMPQTPMLFQGQEFAASTTFHYFADHAGELAKLIREGRAREMAQFPSAATREMQAILVDPGDESTFVRSKLDLEERTQPFHAALYRFHKDVLRVRREDAIISDVFRRRRLDAAVLGSLALALRYFGSGGDDRLILCNLGIDLALTPAAEPLLAPPERKRWTIAWSSEHPNYGGSGTPHPDTEQEGWLLRGRCTMVLRPVPEEQGAVRSRAGAAGSAQEAWAVDADDRT